MSWFSLLTCARFEFEKDKKADIGRFGAFGSLLERFLARIFQGPVYLDFSISKRALSRLAISSHSSLLSVDKFFQALDTILATSVVDIYKEITNKLQFIETYRMRIRRPFGLADKRFTIAHTHIFQFVLFLQLFSNGFMFLYRKEHVRAFEAPWRLWGLLVLDLLYFIHHDDDNHNDEEESASAKN